MQLDIPIKMAGQPNIYKMPKEIFYGAKDLLKKTPVTWWPPQQYKLFSLGRFDLYPLAAIEGCPVLPEREQEAETLKTNFGCFHVKGFLSLKEQQTVIDAVREQCIEQPLKYKFSKVSEGADELEEKKADRCCYSMTQEWKDASDVIKALPSSVEEAANKCKEMSAMHAKG